MPISWSEPSSSSAESIDSGCWKAYADFGIPKTCWCGKPMELIECKTVENRGRRFYKCSATPITDCGNGIDHKRVKWFDVAVEEEFERVRIQTDQLPLPPHRPLHDPAVESIRESMNQMRAEIVKLTDRVAAQEYEISRLKGLLGKW